MKSRAGHLSIFATMQEVGLKQTLHFNNLIEIYILKIIIFCKNSLQRKTKI